MTNKTAAIRYARALLDVAVKEQADLEQIENELSQFADLFKQYPLLEKVLLNPAVPVPRKRVATKPSAAARERRLEKKRRRSRTKALRRPPAE